ncbi:hypothetical protein K491DRAFT_740131 [Lophiostoma macrostomum CBS 122681]|uniref:E3 ubiquitin protein ligase n=1 Tax=Lophiostoma macrostomum CBS 122681 TaxID=1314788 RepID=A0A6A6SJ72_9PLEO|nr:hypothetical protein K491DRAFT_740131 [Lophiostoma macrostomum CBS 122681]
MHIALRRELALHINKLLRDVLDLLESVDLVLVADLELLHGVDKRVRRDRAAHLKRTLGASCTAPAVKLFCRRPACWHSHPGLRRRFRVRGTGTRCLRHCDSARLCCRCWSSDRKHWRACCRLTAENYGAHGASRSGQGSAPRLQAVHAPIPARRPPRALRVIRFNSCGYSSSCSMVAAWAWSCMAACYPATWPTQPLPGSPAYNQLLEKLIQVQAQLSDQQVDAAVAKELKTTCQVIRNENKKLERALQDAATEARVASTRADLAEAQLAQHSPQRFEALAMELGTARGKTEIAEAKICELEDRLEAAQGATTTAEVKIRELEGDLRTAQAEKETAQIKNRELESNLHRAQESFQTAQQEISDMGKDLQTVQEEARASIARADTLQAELTNVTDESAQLQLLLDGLREERQTAQENMDSLGTQNATLNARVEELSASTNSLQARQAQGAVGTGNNDNEGTGNNDNEGTGNNDYEGTGNNDYEGAGNNDDGDTGNNDNEGIGDKGGKGGSNKLVTVLHQASENARSMLDYWSSRFDDAESESESGLESIPGQTMFAALGQLETLLPPITMRDLDYFCPHLTVSPEDLEYLWSPHSSHQAPSNKLAHLVPDHPGFLITSPKHNTCTKHAISQQRLL